MNPVVEMAARLLTAGGGVLVAALVFVQAKTERKANSQNALIDNLQEELARQALREHRLQADVAALRQTVTEFYSGLWLLIGQLRAEGIQPAWTPDAPVPPHSPHPASLPPTPGGTQT